MVPEFRTGPRGVAGVGAFFISNGAVFAALLPWYPLVMGRLGLKAWEFGLVGASFAVGAIVSSVLPSRLIARFYAVPVAVVGTVVLAAAVALAGWSGCGFALAACIFFAGFFDAIVDVAQNVVGVAVQDNSGRSILSSMHALWSLGGVISGAASTAAATAGTDMRLYLAVVGFVCIILVGIGGLLVGNAPVMPKSNDEPSASSGKDRLQWWFVLRAALPLAVIATCGTTIEDVANNWSAIAAVQIGNVPAASAGVAFSVIIGSQCLGRFSGDFLIQKCGRIRIARFGGVFIVFGGLAIVTAQEPIRLIIGLAAVGYGAATLVPSALGSAAHIPGVSSASGVTLVNWIMRVGFLVTSPLVGVITTATSLRWGLSVLLPIGFVAVVLASTLNPVENVPAPKGRDAPKRDVTISPPG